MTAQERLAWFIERRKAPPKERKFPRPKKNFWKTLPYTTMSAIDIAERFGVSRSAVYQNRILLGAPYFKPPKNSDTAQHKTTKAKKRKRPSDCECGSLKQRDARACVTCMSIDGITKRDTQIISIIRSYDGSATSMELATALKLSKRTILRLCKVLTKPRPGGRYFLLRELKATPCAKRNYIKKKNVDVLCEMTYWTIKLTKKKTGP